MDRLKQIFFIFLLMCFFGLTSNSIFAQVSGDKSFEAQLTKINELLDKNEVIAQLGQLLALPTLSPVQQTTILLTQARTLFLLSDKAALLK